MSKDALESAVLTLRVIAAWTVPPEDWDKIYRPPLTPPEAAALLEALKLPLSPSPARQPRSVEDEMALHRARKRTGGHGR